MPYRTKTKLTNRKHLSGNNLFYKNYSIRSSINRNTNYFNHSFNGKYSINRNKNNLNKIYSLKCKLEYLIQLISNISDCIPEYRTELKKEVKSIEKLLKEIFIDLKDNPSLENEFLDYIKIKNMTKYILKKEQLISKDFYISFILCLIKEYLDLIKYKIELTYINSKKEEYEFKYEEFSKYLFEKFRYFNTEIYYSSPQMTEEIRDFTRNVITINKNEK